MSRIAQSLNPLTDRRTGAKTPAQIDGSIKTHHAVRELTQQLLPILANHNLPIATLPTNSMFIIKKSQATILGIERSTLDRKIRRYQLDEADGG